MKKTDAELMNIDYEKCDEVDCSVCPYNQIDCCSEKLFYEIGYEDGKKDAVKHGHWIQTLEANVNGNAVYMCSECGCGDEQVGSFNAPYCWHCGAKMDQEVKEDD